MIASELPQYVERTPSPMLAPWVACYWSLRATHTPPILNRVLPDGCVDVIVGLTGGADGIVVGAMRTAAVVPLAGRVDVFGIRFRPGGALPFLGVPLRELTDCHVALDQVWFNGDGVTAPTEGATDARVAWAERALRQRLRRRRRVPAGNEALATRAVALLREAHGRIGVRDLAAALGTGERQLERACDQYVGLSPKALGRVLRFRRAVRDIERAVRRDGAPPRWTAVAFDAGYADQSHLIRDFKALAGLTPLEFAGERRSVGFIRYGEE